MASDFKKLTDYLIQWGTDQVGHSEKSYLAHCIGVYKDLETWGAPEEVCRAGMFHSIYGTELFQKFGLPLDRRSEVSDLIGERAEWLAYANCAMDRPSFDQAILQTAGPYRILDRLTGQTMTLADADFDELCRIHICDWLEQVGRSKNWDYRREAYRNLAQRLGGVAQATYDRVFGQEMASVS